MAFARATFTSTAALLLAGSALCIAGCPGGPPDPPSDAGVDGDAPPACKLSYIGDKDADIELEVVTLDPSYKAHPFADGGDGSILIPPQGGRVIFVGVRAKNLDPCGVLLKGAVRDLSTMQLRLDTRNVNLDPTDDGWCESDETDISTFSNIPVCSNSWASTDIFDQTFQLIVSVKDRDDKKLEKTFNIVPRCDEMKVQEGIDIQKECLCTCQADYTTDIMCDVKP
jgi:hypothetical protein